MSVLTIIYDSHLVVIFMHNSDERVLIYYYVADILESKSATYRDMHVLFKPLTRPASSSLRVTLYTFASTGPAI
jgi:hypothetical protein